MKTYPQVLTFFVKPQICLFHVVVLLTTAKKWTKVKNARAEQSYCPLNMQIFDVLVAVPVVNFKREFKKRRRLQQRQRQKAVILLVKRTKMIVLHVRHAFFNNSLPYSSKLLT